MMIKEDFTGISCTSQSVLCLMTLNVLHKWWSLLQFVSEQRLEEVQLDFIEGVASNVWC